MPNFPIHADSREDADRVRQALADVTGANSIKFVEISARTGITAMFWASESAAARVAVLLALLQEFGGTVRSTIEDEAPAASPVAEAGDSGEA
jgi:hypothetical protein